MAAGVIDVLQGMGICARWRRDTPGVWVVPSTPQAQQERTKAAKICAFGIHVRHRVAVHGLALNVSTDLRAFDAIVPCGMPGAAVTSIGQLTGRSPAVAELSSQLACALGRRFDLPMVEVDPKVLPPLRDCQMENGTDNMILA
jgi:lipoyl(octanoyl) transferase